MSVDIEQRCRDLVGELNLADASAVFDVTPLTGGVASDIASFKIGAQTICAKFALPKLKVAADWFAPVHRNAAEYAWLEFAALANPAGAVELFGRSEDLHGFAMEFISGPDVYLWKAALLAEKPDRNEATQVGALLGQLQAASTAIGFECSPFQNREDFWAIRIEPYLINTATKHPKLQARFEKLADDLYTASNVLVHGDVSPKNIIFRDTGPVFLDAECATMGDASFDPAFCLNHLILKSFHLPHSRARLLANLSDFWSAYSQHISWEDPAAALEARICALLPALMLARVDGKSPVEYLTADQQQKVRMASIDLMQTPVHSLAEMRQQLIGQ